MTGFDHANCPRPCAECGQIHEGIGGYYDQKVCDQVRARRRLEEARRTGDSKAIRYAERMLELALYVGD